MALSTGLCYQFDAFLLDVPLRELRHQEQVLTLTPRYFDVLVFLVENAGRTVSKQELFDHVWGDVHVSDAALTQCIKDLRKALGDKPSEPRYIKTNPKRGYTFVGQLIETQQKPQEVSRPYKSLANFVESDAAQFFGREREINEIHSKVLQYQSFVLYGRSGAGKSSLLAAGLIPRLRQDGLTPHYIGSMDDFSLEAFEHEMIPSNVVLCFDHFERVFGQSLSSIRRAFEKLRGLGFKFVFVVREDFFAAMAAFKDIFPLIYHAEFRLGLLSRERAKEAVLKPALASGCQFEEQLVEKLLNELETDDGIDPPMLQLLCDHLYDRRDATGLVSLQALDALGQVGGVLEIYLDQVLMRLGERFQLARQLLLRLVSSHGTRVTLAKDALFDTFTEDEAEALRFVLEEMAAARIISVRSSPGQDWVELIHDYILGPILAWMDENDYSLARIRELLVRVEENARDHQLGMSLDELKLLLSAGPALQPNLDQVHLLFQACFSLGEVVPAWLVRLSPSFDRFVHEALAAETVETRLMAIAALNGDDGLERLLELAYDDDSFQVRKAACLKLTELKGDEALALLKQKRSGLFSYWLCLAMIRDVRREACPFSLVSSFTVIAVVLCLTLVRLRRGWPSEFRDLAGASVGSLLIPTFFYGIATAFLEEVSGVFAVAAITAVCSLTIGIGISAGRVATALIALRHAPAWQILGGSFGGFLSGSMLYQAAHALGLTFWGEPLNQLGGAQEGVILGLAMSTALHFSEKRGASLAITALAGALAAGCCIFMGGHLFFSSLVEVVKVTAMGLEGLQQWLTATPLRLVWVSMLEGACLGLGLAAGLLMMGYSKTRKN